MNYRELCRVIELNHFKAAERQMFSKLFHVVKYRKNLGERDCKNYF